MFGQHRRIAVRLTRRIVIRHKQDCFDIGVAITDQFAGEALADRREINVSLNLVLAHESAGDELHFFGSLDVKKRNLAVETAGAFEIDIEFVGPVGHHQKEDASAIGRVGHELLDARNDARRSAAVAFAIRAAKRPVTLVNDHDDLPDGPDHVEDFFEIAFGGADPLGTKILQLDRR